MGIIARRAFGIVITIATSLPLYAQPKAVVGITVDQMKAEYLYRFNDQFHAGLRQLLDEGMVFRNNHYNHIPTKTAPGHATIYTGAQPGDHGIIANDWYDPMTKSTVYCVEDSTVQSVGTDGNKGQMSPRNLLTTTITDELHLSTNGNSFIGSVSIKDRGAILPSGHAGDEVYWFSPGDGFITSSYYKAELPSWVSEFNSEHSDLQNYVGVWDYFADSSLYANCLPNSNPYELAMPGETSGFPYDLPRIIEKTGPGVIRSTPWGNTLVTDFAISILENISDEQLHDNATDFLCVSYSSTDYIGHAFGPRSREVMDTYLRLDEELGRLIAQLDQTFGKGNYILFLTADHAVAENPAHLAASTGMNVQSHSGADVQVELTDLAIAALGFNPIEKLANDYVYLNRQTLDENNLSLAECEAALVEAWRPIRWLKEVHTTSDINSSPARTNVMVDRARDSRGGDLLLEFRDNHMVYGYTGSTHGSGYTYDTHVPLLFFGKGITTGEVFRETHVVDIAPTLSFLLQIPLPHSAYGSPLLELL